MDWTQTLTIIISVFGLFLVAVPFLISRMDANQKENNAKFEAINGKFEAINGKFDAVNTRFNGLENRLTSLEAEAKNTSQRITDLKTDINQRLSTIEGYLVPRKVFHFEEQDHKDEPKEN
jgi:peptidoglycan hydrolase CwlO-like protein